MNDDHGYYRNMRPEVAAFLPATYARVLEIGCGTGNFRKNFREPVEYWGVEPVAAVARDAAGSLDRVLVGSFADVAASLPDGYFDLVVCNDVIEHMADADAFLALIQSKMVRGKAYLVGSVPNVRYLTNLFSLLVRKDWQYTDAGILDRTHLRFFTRRSLQRSLQAHGFRVENLEGINSIGIRARSLTYLAQSVLAHACAVILGRDTLHAQFAFRVLLAR